MEFRNLPPLRMGENIETYLSSVLKTWALDLVDGLHKLALTENLESFEVTVTIPAGTEERITNELDNAIPSGRFFIRHSGDPDVIDGDTEWDTDFVYLKNSGSSEATITAVFFK